MSPITVGLIGMGLMLALLFLGAPIGFSMAAIGFLGILYFTPLSAAVDALGTIPFNMVSSYGYCVVPLFFLMANICVHARLSVDLFNMVHKWIGRLPGGLAAASIGAATIFGAVCSSPVATSLTIGLVALPEMKRYKYDDGLATACVAAGGVLGMLIPPSGILIVYGILTEQSIGALFIAGVIPGLILALMFMIMIIGRCTINHNLGPPGPSFPFIEKIKSIGPTAEIILLIILVIGGLLIGWFTPTEAGGIGAFGAIVFSLFRRRLTWKAFKEAAWETAGGVGMVYTMIIGAFIFNRFLALSTIPMELAGVVSGLNMPPVIIMALIIVIYIVLGCFIESFPMVLLTVPIFYPVCMALGFDPIWFGIIIVIVVGMGMITPPVGLAVFIIAGIAKDVPMGTIFKGIWPFFGIELLFTVLLVAFPAIATWLPSLMY